MQDGRNDNRRPGDLNRACSTRGIVGGLFLTSPKPFVVRRKDALEANVYDVNALWGIGTRGRKQGGAISHR